MPTEKVTMAVVAFFHLSAALISKPTQARRRAVGISGCICVWFMLMMGLWGLCSPVDDQDDD